MIIRHNSHTLFCLLALMLIATKAPAQPGADWTLVSTSSPWGDRLGHSAIVHDARMWIIGGDIEPSTQITLANDVWSSSDGLNWDLATDDAPWAARFLSAATQFKGRIFVLGGYTGGMRQNDVWSSADGVSWNLETASAGWCGRSGLAAATFDQKLWVVGGINDSFENFSDVWSSSDGVNWTQVTSNAGWAPRSRHSLTVHNGRIWVMGGFLISGSEFRDVWSSTDGATWTLATSNAWPQRHSHGAASAGELMWVMGGTWFQGSRRDVWTSIDGVKWDLANSDAPFGSLDLFGSVVHDGKVWILGGSSNGIPFSDVWYSEIPVPAGVSQWENYE